jgi:hypothetical protein
MDWKSPNAIIALVFIIFTLGLFALIVWKGLGGNEALFLIIGHTAAWIEIIVYFFFRKKPPVESVDTTTTTNDPAA